MTFAGGVLGATGVLRSCSEVYRSQVVTSLGVPVKRPALAGRSCLYLLAVTSPGVPVRQTHRSGFLAGEGWLVTACAHLTSSLVLVVCVTIILLNGGSQIILKFFRVSSTFCMSSSLMSSISTIGFFVVFCSQLLYLLLFGFFDILIFLF